jgi:hypothetical protein
MYPESGRRRTRIGYRWERDHYEDQDVGEWIILRWIFERYKIGWSEFLATDPEAQVGFPALPEEKSSGSGTGSTQPREYN